MKRSHRAVATATLLLAALAPGGQAHAHVGTSDVFHEGDAGPYRLLVSVRPPDVIPGTALVEVRAATAAAKDLRVTIVPLPLSGSAAAPTPDVAVRSREDASLFTGRLWLMATGSWQVRVHVDGPAGSGELAVPVPALPLRTKVMGVGLGSILLGLLIFLFAGLVSIVGASVRDGDLAPDQAPDARRRRRGRIAQATAAVVLLVVVIAGASWWDTEARGYQRWVYKPLTMEATVASDPTAGSPGAATLSLSLRDPGWIKSRRLDDLLPDHGHLMHLFVVRLPELDFVGHLHPQQQTPGLFTKALPALPPGNYQLFADIVHRTGLPETAIAQVTLPAALTGKPTGDDSIAQAPTLQSADVHQTIAALPDGTRITWLREPGPIVAGRPTWFRFKVEDRDGKPAADLAPYMGMAGHALFIKHDRTVFAHVHPTGSVPMAALMLVNPAADPHAGHAMHPAALPPEVGFPFACPQPGRYRILVQVKRGDTVETGVFDTDVIAGPSP